MSCCGARRRSLMEPKAEQDVRYGDASASATPWADVLHILERAELFWISSTRVSGQPHVTPLPAIWNEDRLHFCTGADEQKAVNIARNPRVALTTGCNQWKQGLDVVVEGSAVRVVDARRLRTLADLWRSK